MPHRKSTNYQVINMREYVAPNFESNGPRNKLSIDPFINRCVWKMSTYYIIETIEIWHGGYPFVLRRLQNSSSYWVLMKYGQEVVGYILHQTICRNLWLKCLIFIDGIRILGCHKILVNFADEYEWLLQRGRVLTPVDVHSTNTMKANHCLSMICKVSIFLEFVSYTASSRQV